MDDYISSRNLHNTNYMENFDITLEAEKRKKLDEDDERESQEYSHGAFMLIKLGVFAATLYAFHFKYKPSIFIDSLQIE